MHHAGVGFELHLGGGDDRLELLGSEGPEAHGDHGIHLPVALQDGDVLVHAVVRRLPRGGDAQVCPGEGTPSRCFVCVPNTSPGSSPPHEGELLENWRAPVGKSPHPEGPCPWGTCGKALWSGSQQLSATIPASWCWQVRAVYSDKAPPCRRGGWNQRHGVSRGIQGQPQTQLTHPPPPCEDLEQESGS